MPLKRSQLDLHSERHLRDLLGTSQKTWVFCDVFKTSQMPLKKHVFLVKSLRRLKNISLASICDFLKIPRKKCFVCFRRAITIFDKIDVRLSETPCNYICEKGHSDTGVFCKFWETFVRAPSSYKRMKSLARHFSEVAVHRFFSKWAFLKISQYSQKNNCVEISFY